MKKLILMRHAKSDWTSGVPDHERTLNPRGRRGAKAVGAWLAEAGHIPDHALVSTARRTRETYDRLAVTCPVTYEAALYEASAGEMFQLLRSAPNAAQTLLIVAHNPGTALLAFSLVAAAPDHDRWSDIPTASTLVVRFDVDRWDRVERQSGHVDAFVTPHDLPAG